MYIKASLLIHICSALFLIIVLVFRVNDYRRKLLDTRTSHEHFRSDNAANNALRALAQRDATQDCAAWLASGNNVAVSIPDMNIYINNSSNSPVK